MTGFPCGVRFLDAYFAHLCINVEKLQPMQSCVYDQWFLTPFVDVSKICWACVNERLGVHTVSSPDFPFLMLRVCRSFHLTALCWETCWTCWANCDDAAEIRSSSFLLWQQTTGFYFTRSKSNNVSEWARDDLTCYSMKITPQCTPGDGPYWGRGCKTQKHHEGFLERDHPERLFVSSLFQTFCKKKSPGLSDI